MTKKVSTGGGVSNLATALANAGVAASDIVVTSAPAADAQQQQQQQPAPASPQAAIEAAQSLEEEIAAATAVWQHAKATGISKDQFLTFCEIDAEKFAFFKTHKKAIFGSKKQEMDEAAEKVIQVNVIASSGGGKTSKIDEKKSEKAKKKIFGKDSVGSLSKKEIKKADAVLRVF